MEFMLFGVLALLLVFMFINTRRRGKAMKTEQEEKARRSVPGARVLLQGGIYGTVISYDPEDLDTPVEVEIAPGTVIDVHSQAILRIVESPVDEIEEEEVSESETSLHEMPEMRVETPEETRARLEKRDSDES